MTTTGSKECPDADDVGAALDLAVYPFQRVRAGDLDPALAREFAPVGRPENLRPNRPPTDDALTLNPDHSMGAVQGERD